MSDPTPSLWEVFKSVCASFFGVQNEATRRRDFTYGKPGQFILISFNPHPNIDRWLVFNRPISTLLGARRVIPV